METRTIVVLEGDDTGQELLEESLRVLAPDVIGAELELPRFDLSLESRRSTANEVVHEAARAVRAATSIRVLAWWKAGKKWGSQTRRTSPRSINGDGIPVDQQSTPRFDLCQSLVQ